MLLFGKAKLNVWGWKLFLQFHIKTTGFLATILVNREGNKMDTKTTPNVWIVLVFNLNTSSNLITVSLREQDAINRCSILPPSYTTVVFSEVIPICIPAGSVSDPAGKIAKVLFEIAEEKKGAKDVRPDKYFCNSGQSRLLRGNSRNYSRVIKISWEKTELNGWLELNSAERIIIIILIEDTWYISPAWRDIIYHSAKVH